MNQQELRDLTESYYNGVYSEEDKCSSTGKMHKNYKSRKKQNESYDLYDVVLDHLLSEGYADDARSAEVIMSHMSDEWLGNIMEAASNTIMSVNRNGKSVYNRSKNLTRITDALARNRNAALVARKQGRDYDAESTLNKARRQSITRLNAIPPGKTDYEYTSIYDIVPTGSHRHRLRAQNKI